MHSRVTRQVLCCFITFLPSEICEGVWLELRKMRKWESILSHIRDHECERFTSIRFGPICHSFLNYILFSFTLMQNFGLRLNCCRISCSNCVDTARLVSV